MTYVMSKRLYNELRGEQKLTHAQVIIYINQTFGLLGQVTEIEMRE